ncbi:DeoR/GlpR family DNA-binding transcription regulator [Gilliamella sp. B2838]|uniref:DeoR/GlpR family DNA-binding transcription regulator n=1 Tax=Gilliamella sp. B2838 TaxID=2818020 RepID=UPI002269C13B|nr:DeoR/GlpR family DNA-binding transcription regulator [Gilliamella sp. B2838]MCX8728142.1 DeoR/GlpR transcriptional regulator [Gilliamella sp. B2838]
MNASERRQQILALINMKGTLLVSDLSQQYDVSEVTIRTDLRLLEKQGVLIRFHGGATKIVDNGEMKSFKELQLEERYQRFIEAKKRIAIEAVKYVKEGDTIILDSGSTTMLIAEELVKLKHITVITNSLTSAFILSDNSDIMLFMCGGTLRHKTRSFHGKIAEQSLAGISADILFVGADGIDAERGITTFNEGYTISSVMAKAAKHVIAVLDSSKFGRNGINVVLPMSQLDVIITDVDVNSRCKQEFEAKGVGFIAV